MSARLTKPWYQPVCLFKMNSCPENSITAHPWQAALPSILSNLHDELPNTTISFNYRPVEKKLTTGAIFLISVILFFIILNLIRISISVYESFKARRKVENSSTIERKGNVDKGSVHGKKEKHLFETSSYTDFLTNLRKFLDCFCIENNVRRIFCSVRSEEKLSSLHGIRTIAVVWALISHTSMFYIGAHKTSEKFQSALELTATQLLKNAIFIVDTFLVLSGFLMAYLFSQHYKERNGKISWVSFYVHRFIRITPMYFLVLGFYASLFPYMGSGPVWPSYDTNPVCQENWIWHVLFLNNFKPHLKQCLATTWYLACEMQIYIFSPIFLILLMKRPKIGYFLIFLCICGSCFINFVVTKQFKLIDGPARIAEHYGVDLKHFHYRFWEYFDLLYTKPYSRLGTFLVGMALGHYLFRRKSGRVKKNNMVQLFFGWIIAAVFMLISLYALQGREESVLETAVYNGLKHLLFSCSIAWIIFVCVTGQAGFVNTFLSNRLFVVYSRLSYMIYLVHLVILEGYFLSLKELMDYSELSMVILHFLLDHGIIAISLVVSLLFEAPILRMTALLYRKTNQEMKADKEK